MTELRLLLIPTPMERAGLEPLLQPGLVAMASQGVEWQIEVCGFGLIAAAAVTARLLADSPASQVALIGIAGGYGEDVEVGSAVAFDRVSQYGIGAGTGDAYQSMEQLGWQPLSHPSDSGGVDTHPLAVTPSTQPARLLSVCSAAADAHDVAWRMARYPDAMAEDMEGFAVAFACRQAGIPLRIYRGISNLAGDRNKSNWQIAAALEAAAALWCRSELTKSG